MASYKDRLKKLKKEYKEAESEVDGGYVNLAAGTYILGVKDVEITESKSNNLQAQWTYVVLEGDNEGDTVRMWEGLEGGERLVWFRRHLKSLGIDHNIEIEELEALFAAITAENGIKFRGTVSYTSEDFTRLKVKQLLHGYEADGDSDDTDDTDDDPAPAESSGDDDEEGEAWGVGDACIVDFKGKDVQGKITIITEDGEGCTVEFDEKQGKTKKKGYKLEDLAEPEDSEDDDEAPAEEETEEISLAEGMVVAVQVDGKERIGTIEGFNDDETGANVKIAGKIFEVDFEDLAPSDEEPEAAPKKGKKKVVKKKKK